MQRNGSAIAKRYSTALAESIEAEQPARQILGQCQLLLKLLIPEVESSLAKETVSAEFKAEILNEIRSSLGLHELLSRALHILWENNRLAVLRSFLIETIAALDLRLGILRVEYISATPVSDDEKSSLLTDLGQTLGKVVELTLSVQPELLAGCILKIGYQVVDMSLTTRITHIKEALSQGV